MSTNIDKHIQQNELLTVREVAQYLRVSRVTVWRWCQQGVIPASQVGRNWRIRRDDLLHLLMPAQGLPNARPVQPQPETNNHSNTKTTLLDPPAIAGSGKNGPAEISDKPK